MTTTEICILVWAILGMIVVAILLRVGGRRDERGREVSD
jgi:beta-lactamase regulating signal transducer with metallopeptidase domain